MDVVLMTAYFVGEIVGSVLSEMFGLQKRPKIFPAFHKILHRGLKLQNALIQQHQVLVF